MGQEPTKLMIATMKLFQLIEQEQDQWFITLLQGKRWQGFSRKSNPYDVWAWASLRWGQKWTDLEYEVRTNAPTQ